MERIASFSRDGRHRYELGRRWSDGPTLTWIMLNPSAADARIDDPTVRRCIEFSRAWGFGGLQVVNLFAWRAAEPTALLDAADLHGAGGDRRLRRALRDAEAVVVAWGNVHPRLQSRAREVARWVPADAWCLGLTSRGAPRHPLYVRGDTTPVGFREALSVFRATATMAA